MPSLSNRGQNEIVHGQKLRKLGNPEHVWNWDTPAGRVRAQRRAQLIAETADLKPGMRVMEVGCGTGLFTELLSVYKAHILAIDISPDLLSIAKARNLPTPLVEFREMRFEDGIVDGPFDAIVGSSVLHHLEIESSLQRVYELLEPSGVMVFAEPNMLNPQIWAERHIPFIRIRNGVSPDETAIVRWQLSRCLARIGFTDIHIQNVDWLHPATPRQLISPVSRIGAVLETLPVIKEFTGSVLIQAYRPA